MNRHAVPNATLGLPGKPVNGGSQPRFYDFDDEVTRLVKWHPSPHGTKACFNELAASRLGQLIDAPILRGIVVYVPDEIIPPDHKAEAAKPGFHFAVTRMPGENFIAPGHYAEVDNSAELPAAAVHLAWLAIGDQQGHNQYLQKVELIENGVPKTTKRFKLVDMGQMFGNANWIAADVAVVHQTYVLPSHMVPHLTKAKLAAAIDQLKHVPNDAIEQCFSDCPTSWAIPEADKDAGAKRAMAARDKISDILFNGNPSIG